MVMTGLVATADIVTENIIAKTRVRIGHCAQKLCVVRLVPSAGEFCPPAKTCTPAFKKLVFFARVHDDLRLGVSSAASESSSRNKNQFTLQFLNPMSRHISKCAVHYSIKIHFFTEKRTPQHKNLLTNCHFPASSIKKNPLRKEAGSRYSFLWISQSLFSLFWTCDHNRNHSHSRNHVCVRNGSSQKPSAYRNSVPRSAQIP